MKGETVIPAFPCELHNEGSKPIKGFTGETLKPGVVEAYKGMTLRDYFAAKAMQGMLAYPGDTTMGSHHNNNDAKGVAKVAYQYADAMLDERAK